MIPVFGVDASDAAVAKIKDGVMSGTIKQDGAGMAEMIVKVAESSISGMEQPDDVKEAIKDGWRIDIPYSTYTGEDAEE